MLSSVAQKRMVSILYLTKFLPDVSLFPQHGDLWLVITDLNLHLEAAERKLLNESAQVMKWTEYSWG